MVCYRAYYQSSTRLNATNHNEINDAVLTILIADDHPLYRDALELVVNDVFPSASIVSCASQEEVLAVVDGDDNFDLILLDLKLPGATDFSCLALLRKRTSVTPIVIVSAVEDAGTMRDAIEQGATGYLPKSSARVTMRNALQLVMSGGVFMPAAAVSSDWLRRSSPQQAKSSDKQHSSLTERQQVVLELMAQGKSNKEIANDLSITEITVKAHVSAILRKLGVNNRVQAAMLAKDVL
jgi:DNA-binding NarL/FixJ family response regulator